MLILAILGHEVADDLLDNWPKGFGRHEIVARLDDHGEDLGYLIFAVRRQISQEVRVELKQLDLVAANHTRR